MEERDSFKSRLGFILVSAGCAIGIGNVWKFPYITGEYGGAVFCTVLSGVFNPSQDSGGYDGTGCRPFEPQKRAPRF